MRFVHYAEAMREAISWRLQIVIDVLGKDSLEADQWTAKHQRSDDAYFDVCGGQMLVPAPTVAALRWKVQMRNFRGGRRAWEQAITRDKSRLARQLAMIPREQAGRAARKAAQV